MHRFPFEPAFRAQRLCRHLLNCVAGLSILADSHEVLGLACGWGPGWGGWCWLGRQ